MTGAAPLAPSLPQDSNAHKGKSHSSKHGQSSDNGLLETAHEHIDPVSVLGAFPMEEHPYAIQENEQTEED